MTRTQMRLFEDAAGVRMRITEKTLGGDSQQKVDREACVIRDCAILGKNSSNGRVYEDQALDKAVELYENKIVRVNHRPGEKRAVEEDIGVLQNIRRAGDTVRGDFHFIKSHDRAEYFCERAERFPATFGFSHEADGLVDESDDGIQHVIDLVYVESVDLVGTPATNKSLFEENRTMVRKSIRSVIRGVPGKTPGRARMLEMVNDPATAGDVEVSKDATPEEQLDASLQASIQAILGDDTLGVDEKLSKIASLCGDNVPEADDPAPVPEPEKKPEITEDDPANPPVVEKPAEGDDTKKMTESIKSELRKEFSAKFTAQEKLIATLTEQNNANAQKVQRADDEKAVRKVFEESGVKSPTDEQVETAMSLTGRNRETFISTVKSLCESQERGGGPRSSGAGDRDPVGAFPKSSDDFMKQLRS